MIEVDYIPLKKIIIHDIRCVPLKAFIDYHVSQNQNNVRWQDGIVFNFGGFPPTPQMIDEEMNKGIIHWSWMEYAEMPEFKPILRREDSNVEVMVVDNKYNPNIAKVISWLKEQPFFKKDSSESSNSK